MKIIADCGATKSEWAIIHSNGEIRRLTADGINVSAMSAESIIGIISDIAKRISATDISAAEIYLYVAGVPSEQTINLIRDTFQTHLSVTKLSIESDLLGAARAVCGHKPGIAAILGTGSNSCMYDGEQIIKRVYSGGFILGDEGSGGYLGKRLITDFIRHNMPEHVYELVGKELACGNDELIDTIYTKPFPNRFCAQYAKFIRQNMDFDPYFKELVTDAFVKFFERIVVHYPDYTKYRFNAVGSVAYHFKEYLEPVVKKYGMEMGVIAKAPMEGLINYHLEA